MVMASRGLAGQPSFHLVRPMRVRGSSISTVSASSTSLSPIKKSEREDEGKLSS